MSSLPRVQQQFYAFGGGLDLSTPAIALTPGMVIDSENYEPEISGGYRRKDGYERYDGHASPTSATYYLMDVAITGAMVVGNTITGATSTKTAKILAVIGSTLVLGRVSGAFTVGENLTVSAVVQGTVSGLATYSGEDDASTHATYIALAADDLRGDISVITGSGAIRGVWIYKDVVYAFRDNAGGTAGNMWKATASGWSQITFGTQIAFSSALGGATPIAAGDTIWNLGAAPTKTATVVAVLTRAGTWGTNAVGTLIITPLTGTFSNGETIFLGATQKAVSTTAATTITRAAGGRLEFVNANFTSYTSSEKMYGADGVNPCFEFDGTTYIPIYTGMATDTPSHVMFHKFYLFLSFKGSVQFSAITNPYAWTAILGAGEIACDGDVTGFLPQPGSSSGSALAIFTSNKVNVLYGSSAATWTLSTSTYNIGFTAYTAQVVSSTTYGMTARGIQSLSATQNYGDFSYAAVSHLVTSLITSKRGLEISSTALRSKSQYKLFYSDNYCLCMGLTGDSINGIMPLNYAIPVRCIATATLTTGEEVTYFGSDDGYIYRDDIGTSFDGDAIEAWVRMPFNHSKSPQTRKRYRRAIFEIKATGYASVSISYDIGYAGLQTRAPEALAAQTLNGGGGYWDQFTWERFTWDSAIIEQPNIALTGTEHNLSFLLYSNSAKDQSHTAQGVSIFFTPQRAAR